MSYAKAVPVLMYHHVTPNPGLVTVSPQTFEKQMTYLAAKGYTTLSADHFLDFIKGKRKVPAKSVLITFDDGYLDNYVYAFPVLQRLDLHAVLFTVTGNVSDGPARPHTGQSGAVLPECPNHRACKDAIASGNADQVMVRWSEIEAMEASGAIEIQSHTHTHIRWDKQIADESHRLEALEQDLTLSQTTLQQRLGRKSGHLCWPQGYFEPGYQTVAQKQGFEAQYTTIKHVNTVGTPPQHIGRIVVKDRSDAWLARRLSIYASPLLGRLYSVLRGD